MVQTQSAVTLAVNNEIATQEPYVQYFLEWGKAIKPDHYIARRQAARECYRRQLNFMRFIRDCPDQQNKWKIDSNVFLSWLDGQG